MNSVNQPRSQDLKKANSLCDPLHVNPIRYAPQRVDGDVCDTISLVFCWYCPDLARSHLFKTTYTNMGLQYVILKSSTSFNGSITPGSAAPALLKRI